MQHAKYTKVQFVLVIYDIFINNASYYIKDTLS